MERTLLEDSSPTEKTSTLGLSRLYSHRKLSGRPSTSDGSTVSSLRNGMRSASESDAKKKEMEKGKSMDKMREPEKVTPKMKPTELNEAAPPRKHTTSPQDGRAGSRGPNALKPGKSIIEQIGHPDHQGWMRKKGDHYNSWKLRYFIIKGPHLYILRSNSKAVSRGEVIAPLVTHVFHCRKRRSRDMSILWDTRSSQTRTLTLAVMDFGSSMKPTRRTFSVPTNKSPCVSG